MKRTTLAVALATGALAVPAVALAAGNDVSPSATQSPSATPTPQQRDQAPQRGHDCPNHDGSGGSGGSSGSDGSSGSGSQTARRARHGLMRSRESS
jgi:hypothetical protein